ncbi:MAG: type II glyceraldehyde-3-phosphate dehydrogenase, partial [Halobacteria archaeon]|nr:type II glyceraldehyde-3-phosphate dehydrogenase [Halobacteria archaeon]
TIGKRVAEAVVEQDDMSLRGVSDHRINYVLRTLLGEGGSLEGVDLYASDDGALEEMGRQAFEPEVEGTLEDLTDEVDVVVDSTPAGVDAENKSQIYEPNDTRAVFQGGADADISRVSFNANVNYEDARDEDFVRVVSCNTTSLLRTVGAVDRRFGVETATASLVRRGGDPPQDSRGPINSVVPADVPSHHADDFNEVLPGIDLTTLAVKVPSTLGHVHMVDIEVDDDVTEDDVLAVFDDEPRIKTESLGHGYGSTARITERMRDLGRPRYDSPEVRVWEETVRVDEGSVYWINMVHQESIVIPDNIDAIRSLLGLADRQESVSMTDDSMGIS